MEKSQDYEHLLYEIGGPGDAVCTITLNRPDKRNAIHKELALEMIDAFQRVRDEKQVKVVVLTGAGKSFCTGGDLSVFPTFGEHQALMDWMARTAWDVHRSIFDNEKVVVAKVKGHCLAGGLELALMCDLIYASETTKFGLTEINMGILPGWGGTAKLVRSMPVFRAREMVLSGRKDYPAQEIYDMGLLTRVFKDEEFDQKFDEVVANLCAKTATALRMGKSIMNRSFEGIDLNSAMTIERNAICWLVFSPEIQKVLSAMREGAS
jgi:enoyl-CoA hydratase/carnithine racemase